MNRLKTYTIYWRSFILMFVLKFVDIRVFGGHNSRVQANLHLEFATAAAGAFHFPPNPKKTESFCEPSNYRENRQSLLQLARPLNNEKSKQVFTPQSLKKNNKFSKYDSYRFDGASQEFRYFATCCRGLEEVLAEELRGPAIRAWEIRPGLAGVTFRGYKETGYRAALWLRTAHKVLHLLGFEEGGITSREDLFDFVYDFSWDTMLTTSQTLAVDAVLNRPSEELSHTHYTALTVKNAVVDQMRETSQGIRPSVDTRDADLPLLLYMQGKKAKLYRCLSGVGSMHKRGYREAMHVASLKENIAAGLLLASGWDPALQILVDPMCGSATLPIEAALLATKCPPGIIKLGNGPAEKLAELRMFPFTRWQDFDQQIWERVLKEAICQILQKPPKQIFANDVHVGAITLAKRDAILAGVIDHIQFSNVDAAVYTLPVIPDFVITNPPWDMRLEEASESWKILGSWLEQQAPGAKAMIFTGNERLVQCLPKSLQPVERWLMNQGGVDTSLFHFEVTGAAVPKPTAAEVTQAMVDSPAASTVELLVNNHQEASVSSTNQIAQQKLDNMQQNSDPILQDENHLKPPNEQSASSHSKLTKELIEAMRVTDLKEELRKRNIKTSGLKAELQHKLKVAVNIL